MTNTLRHFLYLQSTISAYSCHVCIHSSLKDGTFSFYGKKETLSFLSWFLGASHPQLLANAAKLNLVWTFCAFGLLGPFQYA